MLAFLSIVGLVLYRWLVSEPVGLDVYALYAPGIVFTPLLLWLAHACRGCERSDLALGIVSVLLFVGFLCPVRPGMKQASGLGPTYRLISVNAQSYSSDLRMLAKKARELDPDFICVQELWSREQFRTFTSELPKYTFISNPTDANQEHYFRSGTFIAIRANFQGSPIQSPDGTTLTSITTGTSTMLLASLQARKAFGYGPVDFLNTAEMQRIQARELDRVMREHNSTLEIVAGDFNAPFCGPGVKQFSRHERTFNSVGAGIGGTFPASIPLARIDHILAKGAFLCHLATANFGSDHLGLVLDFQPKSLTGIESDTKGRLSEHE